MVSIEVIPLGKINMLFVKVQRLCERVHRMVVPFNGHTVHDASGKLQQSMLYLVAFLCPSFLVLFLHCRK
jgi:hypothetical protein